MSEFRRMRSGSGYMFARDAVGPPIRSKHPYAFINSLVHQNTIVMHREDYDSIYRGEIQPRGSCAHIVRNHSPADSNTVYTHPRVTITYARRDRERVHAERAQHAQDDTAAEPLRRSPRLHIQADDFYCLDALVGFGHIVHSVQSVPRPLVDRHNYVMAAISLAPKGETVWWNSLMELAEKDAMRLERNAIAAFGHSAEPRVRFGMGFGDVWVAPHEIENKGIIDREVYHIRHSDVFKAMSAFQNHLYQQFASQGYAAVHCKISELIEREIAFPPFKRSVFTTSEICFHEPLLSQKSYDSAFDTMEAITSFGSYDHTKGGHIIFWDDEGVVELPSGATVIIPAGTKRFSFVPVAANERRYLFRQFCSAGVLRWVERGGYSDAEIDQIGSWEAIQAWDMMRIKRGERGIKMFAKLQDTFVL